MINNKYKTKYHKNTIVLSDKNHTEKTLSLTSPALLSPVSTENFISGNCATKPLIFTQKVNTFYKTIPQNTTVDTLGQTRHFPAASKEWFNSIYCYNNNSIKNLTVLDNTLSRFLASYFNNIKKVAPFTKKKQPNRLFPSRLPSAIKRIKRLSLNKVFLGKAELKHSSEKVIITLFIFNQEKISLRLKLKAIMTNIFPSRKLIRRVTSKKPISIKKRLSFIRSLIERQAKLRGINSIFPWLSQGTKPKNSLATPRSVAKRGMEIQTSHASKYKWISTPVLSLFWYKEKGSPILAKAWNKQSDEPWKALVETTKKLLFNKLKFEHSYLLKISPLISRLYNHKKVEFQVINLKNLHLNTDIFTQIIANKLKNRNNKLLNVLRSALSLVRLPRVNRVKERLGRDNRARLWFNSVKNLRLFPIISPGALGWAMPQPNHAAHTQKAVSSSIETMLSERRVNLSLPPSDAFQAELAEQVLPILPKQSMLGASQSQKDQEEKSLLNRDLLSEILINVLEISFLKQSQPERSHKKSLTFPALLASRQNESQRSESINYNEKLINSALHSVKHKTISGVRLEARGRLTKRFTASRSVFKLRWIGGLANIDSSYRGLSTVLLRGHAKSNVQYTLMNSKNRNGSFGIKGWIAGK